MRNRTHICLLFLVCCSALFGQDIKDVERQLRAKYTNKILTLRAFDKSDDQRFDSFGSPRSSPHLGSWTLYSKVEIETFNLKSDHVELWAKRIFVLFPAQSDSSHKMTMTLSNQRLYLEIKLVSAELAAVERSLAQIFVGPNDSFPNLVPDFWRPYFGEQQPPAESSPASNSAPVRTVTINGGVAQGNLTHRVDPVYPQVAKMYRISGDVVLQAKIGTDGQIHDLQIIRPAGGGLDESAVEAVRQWRYAPYRLKGEPVVVDTTITVHYTLKP